MGAATGSEMELMKPMRSSTSMAESCGDVVAIDLAVQRRLVQAGALAQRARPIGHIGRHCLLGARRIGLDVTGDIFAGELVHDAFEGQVHGIGAEVDLHLVRLGVEQAAHFGVGIFGQLLVNVEQARMGEQVPAPTLGGVFGEEDGALVERLGGVQKSIQVYPNLAAQAVAIGAHALRGR